MDSSLAGGSSARAASSVTRGTGADAVENTLFGGHVFSGTLMWPRD
jgi:hypothetical protein